jgi:membrane protease YdiL (CAAX protease family)
MRGIFLGRSGIRVVWRLLIAVALYELLVRVLQVALITFPDVYEWWRMHQGTVLTPGLLFLGEGVRVGAVVLVGLAMIRVEGRSFAEYGLPLRQVFGRRFWQGLLCGFAMLSLLLGLLFALHGYSLGGWALRAGPAVRSGLLYLLAFLLVGFFEEFWFRGYLQATLESGIGFWPAAIALSIAFGAFHFRNPGEELMGLLMAGSFGLLAAFTLRRTGSIWFAIGMHAAWDWAQSYFFGVPNSGIIAAGHLTNSSLNGPNWLTGGSVGPEGSVLVFPLLLLSAVTIGYLFPVEQRAA